MIAILAGCGQQVDSKKLEADLRDKTKAQGMNPTKVSCPSGVQPKQGAVFTCQIELDGKKTYPLDLTISKINDDHTLAFENKWHDGPAVQLAKLVPALTDDLGKQLGGPVRLDCGKDPLAFLDVQRKLHCDLAAGDPKVEVKTKAVIDFDDKLVPSDWHLDPPLLAKAKVEERVTPAVREKAGAGVTVDCGAAAYLPRPPDGNLMCSVKDGDKTGKLKISVDDKLELKGWEILPP
ncbi:MAG TPA: DUF4333 domain-containing protein [Kofleriaceae bacterium]